MFTTDFIEEFAAFPLTKANQGTEKKFTESGKAIAG